MKFRVGQKIKVKPYNDIIKLNKKLKNSFGSKWEDIFAFFENTVHTVKNVYDGRGDQSIHIFNSSEKKKIKGIRKCEIFFYDYEVIPISFIKLKDELFKL